MNTNKFLGFYKKYYGKRLPNYGLCNCVDKLGKKAERIFEIFEPTTKERAELNKQGYAFVFWGSGLKKCRADRGEAFTPLRQTIILFCAAINNEL